MLNAENDAISKSKDSFDHIAELEKQIGLPTNFYYSLVKEDDWSFVIKMAALIDASCTYALSHALGRPEIEDMLSFIELGGKRVGKVKMLLKLGAIEKDQARAIDQLAEIRNLLAHRISFADFTFKDYLGSLSKDRKKNFIRDFGFDFKEIIDIAGRKIPRDDFIIKNPKPSIWLCFSDILACLNLERELNDLRRKNKSLDHLSGLFAPLLKMIEPKSSQATGSASPLPG